MEQKNNTLFADVVSCLQSVLRRYADDDMTIEMHTDLRRDLALDSLDYFDLIGFVETRFEIHISGESLRGITRFDELCAVLTQVIEQQRNHLNKG